MADERTDLVRRDGGARLQRPSWPFMKPRLSRWIALGAGSGLSRTAPGTVGTLFGWLTFAALHAAGGDAAVLVAIAVGLVAGPWAIGRTARDLGVLDHPAIVWDEIVAFWIVLLFVPTTFAAQLVAFLLFRAFDIIKPPPIRIVDRRWKGPWGVLGDDLLAAAGTVFVFAIGQRLLGGAS